MSVQGTRFRLAELLAALSLATDLGMGQPLEQALRTCLLAVAAGEELGLEDRCRSDVYYLALLRFIGCTSDAHEQAVLVGGDEIAFRAGIAPVVMGELSEYLISLAKSVATDASPLKRARIISRLLAAGTDGAKRSIAVHCEVARMMAARIGLPESVASGFGYVFERWDGKGLPGEASGDAIPIPARIVALARDVDIFYRIGGWHAASEILRRRRATAYDPSIVDVFLERGSQWLSQADGEAVWEAALAAEPAPWVFVHQQQLDTILRAVADFADLKSPYTRGHSSGVAALAADAARLANLDEREVVNVWRASLVHDLGRTGIPNGIWDKPGALTRGEWERVRLHPYLTERILAHTAALASLANIAGAHHERLDGSGYHRGSVATQLPLSARILAAADAFQAMTQERPHRRALPPQTAAEQLSSEVDAGRLDSRAVRYVFAAAGHGVVRQRAWPAGLTAREVDVLRLIARGASYREVAVRLFISPRTAEHHVGHIYAKIGVSSRAAAALFAMEHELLAE